MSGSGSCPKTRNPLDAVIMHACKHDSNFSSKHNSFCSWWTSEANEEEVDSCTHMMLNQGRTSKRASCLNHYEKFKCPTRRIAKKSPTQCTVVKDIQSMISSHSPRPHMRSPNPDNSNSNPNASPNPNETPSNTDPTNPSTQITAKHITDSLHNKDAAKLASMCPALNVRASSALVNLDDHKKHSACESKKCSPLDACSDLLDKYLQHTSEQEFSTNLAKSCKNIDKKTLVQAGSGNLLLGARKTADMVHEHPQYTMCDYLDIHKTFLQQNSSQGCPQRDQLAYTSFNV